MKSRPQPSGFGRPPGVVPPAVPDPLDRVAWLLEDYARATEIGPRADLSQRIAYRVAQEPRSTAPRRFLTALVALDARAAGRGLVQSLHTIIEPGPRSVWPRVQAAALVLVVFVGLSAGAVVGLAGAEAMISRLTQGPSDNAASPGLLASPSPSLPSLLGPSDPVPAATEPPEVKESKASATPRAPAPARTTSAPKKSSVKADPRPRAEERRERDENRRETPEPTEPPENDDEEPEREDEGSRSGERQED